MFYKSKFCIKVHPFIKLYGRKRRSAAALDEPPLRASRLTGVEQHTQGVKRVRKQAQSKSKAKKSRVGRDSEAIAALDRIKDARLSVAGWLVS